MTFGTSTSRTLSGDRTLRVLGLLPAGGIAIVGSRHPPAEAAAFAYALAFRLRRPVIAGLSPGIDAAAHRGALAAGVPTVAFVGYGFGRTDPPEHVQLEEAIVAGGGAVATLLPPGTPASPESRIARDRLQAQHAWAVLLVCSEIGGGAMYTMRFACDFGRPRLAVAPPAGASASPSWAGNSQAIAEGAAPIPLGLDIALSVISSAEFGACFGGS